MLWAPTAAERRRAAAQAVLSAAVVAAVWGAVTLYFTATGRLDDFWSAVFSFNHYYSGSMWLNLREGLAGDRLLAPPLYAVMPLLVLTTIGIVAWAGRARRSAAMLAAYAAGSALAVALPGHFHPHYYQLWLPLAAVGAAVGLAALCSVDGSGVWWRRAAAALLLLMLGLQLPSFVEPPQEWSRRKFGERLVGNRAAARAIDDVLGPGETFFQWGHAAELYYYQRPAPSRRRVSLRSPAIGHRREPRTARVLADLTRAPPELVLVSRAHAFPLAHRVPQWITEHYVAIDPPAGLALPGKEFDILIRRDGALAHRLRAGAGLAAAAIR